MGSSCALFRVDSVLNVDFAVLRATLTKSGHNLKILKLGPFILVIVIKLFAPAPKEKHHWLFQVLDNGTEWSHSCARANHDQRFVFRELHGSSF